MCVKGAPHLGELGNVKLIKLANFGPPPPGGPNPRLHNLYESPFVSELDVFIKGVYSTYRHDVLGFVFN